MATNPHQSPPVTVVAVPFPAQSHLNQLLQLSCLLSSSYNLPVHYVGSSIHNRQAKHRFSIPHLLTNIHFHDLPIPPFSSPPPTRGGADTDFPAHLHSSLESSLNLRQPFSTYLQQTLISEAKKKIVIIHDPLMSFVVQDAASLPNVELYCYHTSSAFYAFSMHPKGVDDVDFPFDKLPSMEGCFTQELMNLMARQMEPLKLRSGDLRNTCRVIEGDYVDFLAKTDEKRRWRAAIGPIHLLLRTWEEGKRLSGEDECIKWLDKQPPNSVLYVSFGTTSSLLESQIRELATGLEESKIKFIWVLRDADRGDIFVEGEEKSTTPTLPGGFEERMEGIGVVARGWVPQGEILRHPSTGGFMSHCGWGSCLESISAGVPIAAWPMHSDQPRTATLVTQVLKIGVTVREWSRREELVTAVAVKEGVRTLMASEEGEMMRKRAEEIGRDVRQATEEGGVSCKELESFITHISR